MRKAKPSWPMSRAAARPQVPAYPGVRAAGAVIRRGVDCQPGPGLWDEPGGLDHLVGTGVDRTTWVGGVATLAHHWCRAHPDPISWSIDPRLPGEPSAPADPARDVASPDSEHSSTGQTAEPG